MKKPLATAIFLASSAMLAKAQDRADAVFDRAIERRAIEAANWGMPAVNFDRMVQALLGGKGAFNQVVYWSTFSDWKNQTLTPNPDTIYFKPFIDMKGAGPWCSTNVRQVPRARKEDRAL
jgi:hypothetical protein